MSRRLDKQEIRSAIVDGMADYLWWWAWNQSALDAGLWDTGGIHEGDQRDHTPPRPAGSAKAADDLIRLIELANHGQTIVELFAWVWNPVEKLDRPLPVARDFGRNIAADSLGVDVSMSGSGLSFPKFKIAFDPDLNELEWDGSYQDDLTVNPVPTGLARILLVEDEPDRQRDMVRLFKRVYPNADVDIADNAIDANARLDKQRYGLVVSDWDLADGTTGGDVLEHIRDHHRDLQQRFLFASGNPIVQDMHPFWIMKGEITKAALMDVLSRMPITNPPSCCSGCA